MSHLINNINQGKKYIIKNHNLLIIARKKDGNDEDKLICHYVVNKNNYDFIINKCVDYCNENNYRLYLNINSKPTQEVHDDFYLRRWELYKVIDFDSEEDFNNKKRFIDVYDIFKTKNGYHVVTKQSNESIRMILPNHYISGLVLLYYNWEQYENVSVNKTSQNSN